MSDKNTNAASTRSRAKRAPTADPVIFVLSSPIFHANDIQGLLPSGATLVGTLDEVSKALNEAINASITAALRQLSSAPDGKRAQDWYQDIANLSERLSKMLLNIPVLQGKTASAEWAQMPDSPPNLELLARHISDNVHDQGYLVSEAPKVLALLQQAAKAAVIHTPLGTKGTKIDDLKDRLFHGLAVAHDLAFDGKPEIRLGRVSQGYSIDWVRNIIRYAYCRLPEVAETDEVRDLKPRLVSLAGSGDQNIGRALNKGWKESASRWPRRRL